MGLDAMILVFWILSIKPTFSLSSFTFIKKLFSSSLSVIRVVSSAYLRLLIFLPVILILACDSSSPVLLMMYSACKLNKHGDNIQPWCTLFPIWNQLLFHVQFLTKSILTIYLSISKTSMSAYSFFYFFNKYLSKHYIVSLFQVPKILMWGRYLRTLPSWGFYSWEEGSSNTQVSKPVLSGMGYVWWDKGKKNGIREKREF